MDRKIAIESLNLLALLAVVLLSTASFIFQFYYHELPCPLCMLQRLGLLFIGFGLVLDFRFGFKASHYGISLLGALFMIAVAVRQILLHILPGDAGFGSPMFGLHLYTWVLVFGFFGILYIAMTLLVQGGVSLFYFENNQTMRRWFQVLAYIFFALVVCNVINVLLICGISVCPENPTAYLVYSKHLMFRC